MFRPREVINRLALGHFETNVQISLLEMKSHFVHNAFNVNVCTYVRTYVRTYVCICVYVSMYYYLCNLLRACSITFR